MVIILTVLIVLLLPATGFCFGPAFHLKIGNEILNYLTLFSPLTQQILQKYPLDFIYGNISPDIVIGKRFTPYHYHCHNWNIVKGLIEEAKSDKQRAFTYGYMAHVASDLVAHNFFIPYEIISTFKSRTLTHLYWETRLDNKVERDIWQLIQKFKMEDFSEHEDLLDNALAYNLFPFKVNKKIFMGYIVFSSLKQWHKTLNIVKKISRHKIPPLFVQEVFNLSVNTSLDALLRRNDDYIYKLEPTGQKTINLAKMIKTNLKRVHMIKEIDKDTEINLSIHFKSKLKKAFYNPDDIMHIISEENQRVT